MMDSVLSRVNVPNDQELATDQTDAIIKHLLDGLYANPVRVPRTSLVESSWHCSGAVYLTFLKLILLNVI